VLGLDSIDWANRLQDIEGKQNAAEEEEHKSELAERKPNTQPSRELKGYSGRYENPGYGTIIIQPEGDGLSATLNKLSFPLRHYHYDVFEAPPDSTGAVDIGKLRFLTGMNGNIDSIAALFEPDAPEIIFRRLPENPSPEQKKK
jgi:hypothetical protein